MSIRESTSVIRYKVSVEGGDESLAELQGVLTEVQQGIGLFSHLDYLALSWQRAIQQFDMRSFLSVTLSTISAFQMMIRLIRSAEVAQIALNAAMAVGRLLEGPSGWAILAGVGVAAGATIGYFAAQPGAEVSKAPLTEEQLRRARAYEQVISQYNRREHFRSVMPP